MANNIILTSLHFPISPDEHSLIKKLLKSWFLAGTTGRGPGGGGVGDQRSKHRYSRVREKKNNNRVFRKKKRNEGKTAHFSMVGVILYENITLYMTPKSD